jgi:DNA mismatch repair ATPase MutL
VVDANIHPKKLEVKLQREGNIRELFRELFKGHKNTHTILEPRETSLTRLSRSFWASWRIQYL